MNKIEIKYFNTNEYYTHNYKKVKFHTSEEKIQSVQRYKCGKEFMGKIAKGIGVHESIFTVWVRLYEHQGESAFIKSYTSYSTKFKMDVLNYINEMGTSYRETAAIFNISSPETIRKWQLRFEQGGIDALETKKKGHHYMKKESKKTEQKNNPVPTGESVDSLQAKVERLEMRLPT